MQEITYFNTLILRGGPGGITGCAITRMTEWRDGNGKTIAARESDAIPVALAQGDPGIPLADVLGEVNSGALAQIEALNAQVAALTTERDEAVSALAGVTAERDALQAQIDAAAASAANSVPAHQLRRALRSLGMLPAVNAYMSALPEDDEMRESWEYAPYFRRDALGIEAARVALGLTVEQVDALFIAAGNVQT